MAPPPSRSSKRDPPFTLNPFPTVTSTLDQISGPISWDFLLLGSLVALPHLPSVHQSFRES